MYKNTLLFEIKIKIIICLSVPGNFNICVVHILVAYYFVAVISTVHIDLFVSFHIEITSSTCILSVPLSRIHNCHRWPCDLYIHEFLHEVSFSSVFPLTSGLILVIASSRLMDLLSTSTVALCLRV